MSEPLVSVGLPFYNSEKTLAEAVKSVFAQKFDDWELILVDDGSIDKGLQIARDITDKRVRIVVDSRHLGLAARLNQIAELAQGRYLARMDADDLMHPMRLSTQVDFLETNFGVDVVGTGMYVVDKRLIPIAKRMPVMVCQRGHILSHIAFLHPTVTAKREWFRKNRYDSACDRAEDRELWCRTFGHSRFANIPKPLYFYREYTSFSLRKYVATSRINMLIYKKYGPELIGSVGTKWLQVREMAKLLIYHCAFVLDAVPYLIHRRSEQISSAEKMQAREILSRILSLQLPK